MGEECFNCSGAATHRYTLILGPDKILEDKLLCGGCAAAFQREGWLEVHESPLFMRGADDSGDDSTE